ncbi:MAG: DUF3179 domain-containing protein [Chloroflexi bacterium AL-W]|nr:DUF3179 domain-containing protein [Chloroflexi bacterium AL-N1]NOK67173.1 DUF3179 domain-containing protein [Chloroflexi bacterium AL-N10]NOK75333.1 DUF3179 domain-containing protein [Chloroflexi bacterium AL-N5]NOK82121.1 DUF3179 domain-containing protein [Chloroflexi bacterium AL-W]NOK89966.1 DUF3179 domain-containing protein [Chloroflexi bacterium AL-N15]
MFSKDCDKTLPARIRVVGIIEPTITPQVVYLKEELLGHSVVKNEALDSMLVALNNTVNGFKRTLNGRELNIMLHVDKTLSDISIGTVWNIRDQYLEGEIPSNLEPIAISDEYWFSWKTFHSQTKGFYGSGNPPRVYAVESSITSQSKLVKLAGVKGK